LISSRPGARAPRGDFLRSYTLADPDRDSAQRSSHERPPTPRAPGLDAAPDRPAPRRSSHARGGVVGTFTPSPGSRGRPEAVSPGRISTCAALPRGLVRARFRSSRNLEDREAGLALRSAQLLELVSTSVRRVSSSSTRSGERREAVVAIVAARSGGVGAMRTVLTRSGAKGATWLALALGLGGRARVPGSNSLATSQA